MRALQASLKLGPQGARWAACRASAAGLHALEDTAAALAGAPSFYCTAAADGASAPASTAAAAGGPAASAASDAWVPAGGTPLSQTVAPFASLEQRHAEQDGEQQQQQRRQRGRPRQRPEAAGTGSSSSPWKPEAPLGPSQLLREVREARSPRRAARLLVEHKEVAGPRHLIAAAVRLGQLQSKGRNPRPVNQEAFSGALDLALEMLHQSGEPLQFGDACRLLDAAAWMQVQLTEHQAAALEAAVVAGLTSGARLNSAHVRFMLSAYIRLGLQPGPELAAALAPGQCLVTAEDSEALTAKSEQQAAAGEAAGKAAEGAAADPAAAAAAAAADADAAAAVDAAQAIGGVRLMDDARLSSECVHVQSLRRLLRVALLHRQQLTLPQLLAALNNFGERVHEEPRQLSPSVQAAFGALRAQALASLAAAGPDAFPKLPDVSTCAQLLRASADLQLPLSRAEQAAVEEAAVRGWEEARMADLHMIAAAYDALGMQPGRDNGMAAQLQQAGEWLLQAALPRQLAETMAAWAGRRWPVSPAMAAAAEHRALQLLEPVESTAASAVVLALEGFVAGQGLFRLSPRLATAMRTAVLHHLPEASAEFASLALSACRKLRLLPDEHLLAAFIEAAPQVLPVNSDAAHAYVPRLLMALHMQGWHYSVATPAVRSTVEALLRKQRVQTERIVSVQHPTPEELRGNLGLLAHNLQLLAAVGIRPTDQDLTMVLRYLRRHQSALSRPQMERLKEAFDAWQLSSTVRKLRVLRR